LVVALTGSAGAAAPQDVAPPTNAPATPQWDVSRSELTVEYNGSTILTARVTAKDAGGKSVDVAFESKAATPDEKVEQRLTFTPAETEEGTTLVLTGTVTGSEEAFPAETAGEAQRRFPLVRNSHGMSRNLRNNAIYDRRGDWVLVGPVDGSTRISPTAESNGSRTFDFHASGQSIQLIFRPRFYQKHRNLKYYEPWTYKVWKGSVTGYCTWWAYKYGFTQETLDQLVDVFADKRLPDFGYNYIQLDDTYQIGNGSCPENWLTWNQKFPGGPQYTINKIRSIGMKPGIWVHRVHRPSDPHVADIGKEHPDWFVRKADGSLFTAHGFYVLNTKNPAALDAMARRTYRELKKQGWDYVKIDGAGDLLNAYKNKECDAHFKKIGSTPEESLRDWDRVAREELGSDVYILNCWGVGPGLNVVGLVDGSRLAGDGFQPEQLANRSSLEGVVWRNDPDHCDILGTWLTDEDAMMPVFGLDKPAPVRTIVRPAICSIASGVLMVSDKVEVYTDDVNIEGMKRSAPVLPTVPGQLYDPGHRAAGWWLNEIDRPFDHWTVLTRMQWAKKREKEWKFDLKGLPAQEVVFADLGLDPDREYVVFEFWTQQYLGKRKGSFTAPAMDENTGMQVFAIREAREHPWVIGTTRHLSQGGVSLLDEKWDAGRKTLSGKSAVVAGDPYVLTVHLPQNNRIKSVQFGGEKVEIKHQEATATIRIVPSATATLQWEITL
jgi:hypothetical protein